MENDKTTIYNCTSIFGHKFEPRYELSSANVNWVKQLGLEECSEYFMKEMTEKMRNKIYIHDICAKCGHIVKKP